MKTIDMKIGNKVVSFTTKSVTIDGTEYSYSKMSGIKHSSEKHVYAFKYDGAYKYLPYDPKYTQVLAAIFKQVNALDKKRQAILAATQEIPMPIIDTPVDPNAPATSLDVEDKAETDSASDEAKDAATEAQQTEASDAGSVETQADAAEGDEKATDAGETQAEGEAQEASDTTTTTEEESVVPDEIKANKKSLLKKALLIFLAIIVFTGAITAVYFAFFGTSSKPIVGPNSTDSQQYDNIDELIQDLN